MSTNDRAEIAWRKRIADVATRVASKCDARLVEMDGVSVWLVPEHDAYAYALLLQMPNEHNGTRDLLVEIDAEELAILDESANGIEALIEARIAYALGKAGLV